MLVTIKKNQERETKQNITKQLYMYMLLYSLRYDDTRWDLLLLYFIIYEYFLKELLHKVAVIDHDNKLDQIAIFFLTII